MGEYAWVNGFLLGPDGKDLMADDVTRLLAERDRFKAALEHIRSLKHAHSCKGRCGNVGCLAGHVAEAALHG